MARFPKPVAIVNSHPADEFSSSTCVFSLILAISGTTSIQIRTASIENTEICQNERKYCFKHDKLTVYDIIIVIYSSNEPRIRQKIFEKCKNRQKLLI